MSGCQRCAGATPRRSINQLSAHNGSVRTMGWPYPFRARTWSDIGERVHAMAALHVTFRHIADVVDSVQASGADHLLAGCTSMHDLIVVTQPIPEPPYDVVAVRAPSSIRPAPDGMVVIEHLSVTGRNDRIVRPTARLGIPLLAIHDRKVRSASHTIWGTAHQAVRSGSAAIRPFRKTLGNHG